MRILLLTVLTFFVSNLALAQDFYLAPNGVTCMCPNAPVGASGDPGNGVVYTKRTRNQITPQNAATTCTSGITDMSFMFWDSPNFQADLSTWDTSNVTNMANMFFGVASFNSDISLWDVSNVIDMSGMFYGTSSFNQPIGGWDVSNVTNMNAIFTESIFNQDISSWDVSNVTNMFQALGFLFNFDQDISDWEFHPDVDLRYFLTETPMSTENYDLLLESLRNQQLYNKVFGAHELKYCNINARDALINENGWFLEGDSYNSIVDLAIINVTVLSDPGYCTASNVDLGEIAYTGGCGTISITNDAPVEFPLGVTTVTWTLVDENGFEVTHPQQVEVIMIADEADVCYVTADPVQPTLNRVFTTSDPALNGQNVDFHEVLRESPSGTYETIGFIVPPEDSFLDVTSDNNTQAYRYKVQTTDVCGQVLTLSDFHKTILLQSSIATNNSVNLAWNPYIGVSFNTYNVYRSVNGANYELLTSLSSTNTSYNDTSANVVDNFYEYYISIDIASCSTDPFQSFALRSNLEYINPNLVIKDNTWLSSAITIYPNPASDYLNISVKDDLELKEIVVYNTLGQRLMISTQDQINVSTLPSGVYYLSIDTDQGRVNKTLVRE